MDIVPLVGAVIVTVRLIFTSVAEIASLLSRLSLYGLLTLANLWISKSIEWVPLPPPHERLRNSCI